MKVPSGMKILSSNATVVDFKRDIDPILKTTKG